MSKQSTPTRLVARLKERKVSADAPEALHANAHRVASNTDVVNSARQKIVSCDSTLSARILRSGFWKINVVETGCSIELLYAKKTVKARETAVTQATIRVKLCCRMGEGKSSPEGSNRDCRLSIACEDLELNVGR